VLYFGAVGDVEAVYFLDQADEGSSVLDCNLSHLIHALLVALDFLVFAVNYFHDSV